LVPKMAEMEGVFERLVATIGLGRLEMPLIKAIWSVCEGEIGWFGLAGRPAC